MLLQMTWPPHPHTELHLPNLLRASLQPVLFDRFPPIEKLVAKMGDTGKDPSIQSVVDFVKARHDDSAREATLPDMIGFSKFLQTSINKLSSDKMFAVVD